MASGEDRLSAKELRERNAGELRSLLAAKQEELQKTKVKDLRDVLFSLLKSEKQKAMLANVNEEFALEVIDPALVPVFRNRPKRKLIVLLGGASGLFIGILSVYLLQFLGQFRTSANRN